MSRNDPVTRAPAKYPNPPPQFDARIPTPGPSTGERKPWSPTISRVSRYRADAPRNRMRPSLGHPRLLSATMLQNSHEREETSRKWRCAAENGTNAVAFRRPDCVQNRARSAVVPRVVNNPATMQPDRGRRAHYRFDGWRTRAMHRSPRSGFTPREALDAVRLRNANAHLQRHGAEGHRFLSERRFAQTQQKGLPSFFDATHSDRRVAVSRASSHRSVAPPQRQPGFAVIPETLQIRR